MNKRNLKYMMVAALLFAGSNNTIKAQSVLGQIASALTSSSSTASTVSNLVGSLIGTSTVSESSLKGTWTYSEPAVAFESENILTSVAGAAAATKIEKKMLTAMTKAGFKAGKSTITFNSDNTFTCSYGSTTGSGTYKVSGSTITLTSTITGASVSGNVKLSGSELQITFTAKKLYSFVSTVTSKASAKTANSQLSIISTLMGNVNGIQVGMKFKK